MSHATGKVCSKCYQFSIDDPEVCECCGSDEFASDEWLASRPEFSPVYAMRKAEDRHIMETPDDTVYMLCFMLRSPEDGECLINIANLSLESLTTLVVTALDMIARDESVRRDKFVDVITPSLNSLCERAKIDKSMSEEGAN